MYQPFTSWCVNPEKPMSQIMLVTVVADGTQVIVGALGTLPTNSKYRLLMTRIAHGPVMFQT